MIAFRKSLKMTQKAFAESIGVSRTTYNNYETGVREPKSDFWIAISNKYNVTVDYLMGVSDDPKGSDGVARISASKIALLAAVDNMTEDEAQAWLKLIRH